MANRFQPRVEFNPSALKRPLIAAGALLAALFVGSAVTTRVDTGHVGLRVRLAGSERGVADMPVVTGWVWFNPITEQIIVFPTSVQNVVWTASPHEGRAIDESVSFSSTEGVNVNADVGLSFHVDPMMAPKLFSRFRQNNMLELADRYMRSVVREAFNEVTSAIPVQEIYGSGKSKMLAAVTAKVSERLGKDGVVIDQLTINGSLRLPQNVADAINRAMEATQNAIQSENRVRQVRAEADQAVTQAHGLAEATRQKAQGEADGQLIRARSEAKANEIIRLSTNPAVLQYRALERWDGKLPVYNAGGQLPLLTFDASKLTAEAEDPAREKKLRDLLAETATPAPAAAAPSPAAAPAPAADPAPPAK